MDSFGVFDRDGDVREEAISYAATRCACRNAPSYGSDWEAAARHEAGHAAVAHFVSGGYKPSAYINKDGSGMTGWQAPADLHRAEEVAVAVAGALAEGVSIYSPQCRGDLANIRAAGGSMSHGTRIARHALAARGCYRRRVERSLRNRGRF